MGRGCELPARLPKIKEAPVDQWGGVKNRPDHVTHYHTQHQHIHSEPAEPWETAKDFPSLRLGPAFAEEWERCRSNAALILINLKCFNCNLLTEMWIEHTEVCIMDEPSWAFLQCSIAAASLSVGIPPLGLLMLSNVTHSLYYNSLSASPSPNVTPFMVVISVLFILLLVLRVCCW